MTSLINIVHPYIYKANGVEMVAGDLPQFAERDKKVSTFVNSALDKGITVIHHRHVPQNTLLGLMQYSVFAFDPKFKFLNDKRLKTAVTTIYGVPITKDRPIEIKEKDWIAFSKLYTSDSKLRSMIGSPEVTFFDWRASGKLSR